MGKRIGIIGTGAVGAFLGGSIASGGEDIVLIDPWKENVDAMARQGVWIEDSVAGDRHFQVRALHTDALDRLEGPLDILLVSVKSYNTEWAVKTMLPYLAEDAWVVSAQNSINEEIIAPLIGAHRTLGCVVRGNCQMMEPAHVVITRSITQSAKSGLGAVSYFVGELDGSVTPRAQEVAGLMGHAGKTVVTDNLRGERWAKLIVNCVANAVSGASGLKSSEVWKGPALRRVSTLLAAETVRVGLALGYNIPSVLGDVTPEEAIASAEGRSTRMDETLLARSEGVHPKSMPSLMQDVIKGRPTEVDYLNGLVVRKARGTGVPTPVSEGIVEVVHRIERGEHRPNPEAVAQLAEVG